MSDPGPTPTYEGRFEEIHTTLRNAGVRGPLVLVGHSIGAAFARLYAARYPGEVRGMVIGDHAGRYRVPNSAGMNRPEEPVVQKLPPESREMHRWVSSRPGSSADSRQFLDSCIAEASRTTLGRADPLGDTPLVVIANEYVAASDDYRKFELGLLALSHNSESTIAPNSGHNVPIEAPDVFVRAVRNVVAAARDGSKLRAENLR